MNRFVMLVVSMVLASTVVGCRVPTARAAANGTTQESIMVDGMTRTYRLHMPPDADGPLPLVFNFHGYGGTGADQEILSGMDAVADGLKFVVVYPNGIDKHWRFGVSEISDVNFVNAVIDHLAQMAPLTRLATTPPASRMAVSSRFISAVLRIRAWPQSRPWRRP